LGANFEAGKRFALLPQDGNDVVASAAAQADENEFHGTIASGLVTVDEDGVPTV
jgi:hypothetical protein